MSLNATPKQCPLCGNDNACGLFASPEGKGECWCFSRPAKPDVLKRLPADLRNQACLCSHCLQRLYVEMMSNAS